MVQTPGPATTSGVLRVAQPPRSMTDLRRLQVVDHLVLISNFGVSTATAAVVVVTLCDPRRRRADTMPISS